MATLIFSGLTVGATADLYLAAQVEPYKQARAKPPFAPVASVVVAADGKATFATRPSRVEHVVFVNGQPRHQMDSTTRVT